MQVHNNAVPEQDRSTARQNGDEMLRVLNCGFNLCASTVLRSSALGSTILVRVRANVSLTPIILSRMPCECKCSECSRVQPGQAARETDTASAVCQLR